MSARRFWQLGRREGWARTDGAAGDMLHCAGPDDESREFRRWELTPAQAVAAKESCGFCYLQVGHTENAHFAARQVQP